MHRKRGFTLLELVIVLFVIGVLIAFFFPTNRRGSREPARRSTCKNNLKQIGLALHNYHDDYGSFPPAYTVDAEGNRLHSWRTLLLPYLDQEALYKKIDLSKPWNDPANAEILQSIEMPYLPLRCPSINCPPEYTNYLAVVSPRSAINPKAKRFRDITDGSSNTLLVIEVDARRAVHWMDPTDASVSDMLSLGPDSELPHQSGFQALLGDGRVRFLDAELSAEIRRALISIDGDQPTCDF